MIPQIAFVAMVATIFVGAFLVWRGTGSLWRGGVALPVLFAILYLGPLLIVAALAGKMGRDYHTLSGDEIGWAIIAGSALMWGFFIWTWRRR